MKRKSSRSGSWRTRTRGTPRQVGSKFKLRMTSRQKLASQLPTVTGRVRGHLTVTHPERTVRLALVRVKVNNLVPTEKHPVDLDARAQWFVEQYRKGIQIPPIMVHRNPATGDYEIKDGHARWRAAQMLGLKELPAVENSILESLGKGAKAVGKAITSGARMAERVGRYGYRTGMKVGKAAEETLSQAGRISRAYRGEVAPREEIEHEERLAEIRARRGAEPRPSTAVYVGREDEAEIVRRRQELEGLKKEIAKQQGIIRLGKWSKVERRGLREKISSLQKQARETAKGLPQKAKKGFRTMKEYVTSSTPELYRTRRKREE